MSLQDQFLKDFNSTPGLEEIYYTSILYQSQQFSIPKAKRSKIITPAQAINSNFLSNVDNCIWEFPNQVLIPGIGTDVDDYEGVFEVMYGDIISSYNGEWLVVSFELCDWETIWKVYCTRMPQAPGDG